MKYKNILFMIIMMALFIANTTMVEAKTKKPFPYRINNPHIVEKNHRVTIEWQQTEPVYVVLYKLTYNKRQLRNDCKGVETFGQSCMILWQGVNFLGIVHKTDRDYRNGDEYYIQQNVYLTHNGGYGPFFPTYR